ncbi:MAG: glycosyltransferase [Bacteroidota bacterium]
MNKNEIFISIALPVYNGEDYLEEAIESILSQKYAHFELIVSDNCSNDRTPEILKSYQKLDDRIKIFQPPQFLKQADNVNFAISHCSANWVQLFCHDDIMISNCLSEICEAIKKFDQPNLGFIGHRGAHIFSDQYVGFQNGDKYQVIDVSGNNSYSIIEESPSQITYYKGQNYVKEKILGKLNIELPALTTAVIKKKFFEESGGFSSLYRHFDVFKWYELFMEYDFLEVRKPYTLTRIHPNQVAVNVRNNMRSLSDHRKFWTEFIIQYGDLLNLTPINELKIKFKPYPIAGTALAIQLLKGNYKDFYKIFLRLPLLYMFAMPFFVFRSYWKEKKRTKYVRSIVGTDAVYP